MRNFVNIFNYYLRKIYSKSKLKYAIKFKSIFFRGNFLMNIKQLKSNLNFKMIFFCFDKKIPLIIFTLYFSN